MSKGFKVWVYTPSQSDRVQKAAVAAGYQWLMSGKNNIVDRHDCGMYFYDVEENYMAIDPSSGSFKTTSLTQVSVAEALKRLNNPWSSIRPAREQKQEQEKEKKTMSEYKMDKAKVLETGRELLRSHTEFKERLAAETRRVVADFVSANAELLTVATGRIEGPKVKVILDDLGPSIAHALHFIEHQTGDEVPHDRNVSIILERSSEGINKSKLMQLVISVE